MSAAALMATDAPCGIEQVQLTGPGPGEVLVKITGTGLCHADVLRLRARLLIPRLIDLWQRRPFPFDKLHTAYPLSQVSQAEADAASGAAVKPVLIPDPLA
jgi:Zn-dependent alcohol dehydrogenase